MLPKIGIEKFLELKDHHTVIDVRSPSEYYLGHIPGSFNIPLFSDDERAAVGTSYVKEGREQAVKLGLKIVGPKLSNYIDTLNQFAKSKTVLVYCWRGGMRSSSMSWLFSLSGFKPLTLEGGYKTYRRFAQSSFTKPYRFIVLGGKTGSGKTDLLKILKQKGEQVLDLEGLANHKGSAFGWINQSPQPKTEHFENLIFEQLLKLNALKPIWIEDESISIGSVFIPRAIFVQMAESPTIAIEADIKERVKRLAKDYTQCDRQNLIDSVLKIQKKLGLVKAQMCIDLINKGNLLLAIELVLEYYDKTYRYGLSQKKIPPQVFPSEGNLYTLVDQLISMKSNLYT